MQVLRPLIKGIPFLTPISQPRRSSQAAQSLAEFLIILAALTSVGLMIGAYFNPKNGVPVTAQNTAIDKIKDINN